MPTTTPTRHAERARYDEATVHGVLDSALVGHLAYVADGRPHLLPMLFVRLGGTVFLHSSTGAHPARLAARQGSLGAVFETTLVDGLVLARSAFNHSANYRSVVAHGDVRLVKDPERKNEAMTALLDKLVPGRSADARMPADDELRKTAVLALDLEKVGAKVRTGDPVDDEKDLVSRCWAGVLPIESRFSAPLPAGDQLPGVELPPYLAAIAGSGLFV